MTVIEGMIIFAKLYRFGLGMDKKCMTISPDRFSPMRKLVESRDHNNCRVIKAPYSKAKCVKPAESSEVRPIIIVLSFTFQVGIAYESNFGIDYIKYAGNIPNSSILGIYSTLITL